MMCSHYISTLTIAGSDSCGGAGIQADLKTMSALGCYACSVVTAVTAQDTCQVSAVMDIPADLVAKQLQAVLDDIRPAAVKTGMLANAAITEAVADGLKRRQPVPLVVDPVMVATSGDPLVRQGTVRMLIERLLPLADLVTPNIPEAQILAGMELHGDADCWTAARRILDYGCGAVLIKGGHGSGVLKTDRLLMADGTRRVLSSPVVDTPNTHGTGCTLSAAITAFLARGYNMQEAVALAKGYLDKALEAGKEVTTGHGHGPVDHFFNPEQLIIRP